METSRPEPDPAGVEVERLEKLRETIDELWDLLGRVETGTATENERAAFFEAVRERIHEDRRTTAAFLAQAKGQPWREVYESFPDLERSDR
jgi:hypothetical protein